MVAFTPVGMAPSASGLLIERPVAGPNAKVSFPEAAASVDPELLGVEGRVDVMVAFDGSESLDGVASLFDFARVMPSAGGVRILRGSIDASRLVDIERMPGVRSVLKDRPIAFPAPLRGSDAPLPAHPFRFPFEGTQALGREPLAGAPEVTMYDVVDFTGARRAWTQLGATGAGVTIAIVDTGVDHGAMGLGDAAVARDASGRPTSFDPDGGTFGRTTLTVGSYLASGRTFVRTLGTDPSIYIFDIPRAFGPYGPANVSWSDPQLFAAPFPRDMDITGLPPSRSGAYHFGVLSEWHVLDPFIYLDLFPVIVIDAGVSGVYDTAVVDLSFDWSLDQVLPPDYSFADETALRASGGPYVASRDMNADGFPEVSAGSLAHGLDIWGLEAEVADRFRILAPIDPDGEHVVFVYDWIGHGTSVAGTAAGRETSHPLAGPGIARGARIMGIPIFFWGDVVEGWLWAAGFDLVNRATPRTTPDQVIVYGEWTYTGNHRADIISNSWGVSDWLTFRWIFSNSWYDLVTVLEDALMTPGFASPNYPGTLIVHAGGNGGSGYGTVTEPAFSSLGLTVGASTSLDNTALPFGGFHGDVMSWSARGPNAFGAPKPDLVMVGAWAYTAAPPWFGNGTGSNATNLFGGTSQAAPAAAGSGAVAFEAFRGTRGRAPSPFEIKSILKSTADDLGYDAFVQGAGQVNVYNAAAFARNREGLLVTSPASWQAARPRLAAPWASAAASYGSPLTGVPPSAAIHDTSWFAGTVAAGRSTSTEFTIASPASGGSIALSAVTHERIATLTRAATTGTLGDEWLEGYGAIVPLQRTDLAAGSELMLVRAHMAYTTFDPEYDQVWNHRIRIVVGDWVDANTDGIVAPAEFRVFNYGYNAGTTVEARVGFPLDRFAGRPALWISQVPSDGRPFAPIAVTVQVEFYDRAPWSWISLPASTSSPGTVTATLTVPSSAAPGVYEGQVIFRPAAGNGTVVPVSVVVPRVLDGSVLSAGLTGPPSNAIYDSSRVDGYFDWRWRYEAGDWRLWFVQVDDPTVIALRINAAWGDRDTDVDLWSLSPGGVPLDSSFSPYGGSGNFRWDTRTGRPDDFILVPTDSGLTAPGPGLYTVALHNVLFGSTAPPESLTGQVAIAKLAPRDTQTRTARPGDTVSVQYTLQTGFALTSVFWEPLVPPGGSAFPGRGTPARIPNLGPGSTVSLTASFIVPDGTPDGEYANYFAISAAQLFSVARIDIVVDSVAPSISSSKPVAGAVVGGTVAIAAQVEDDRGMGSATFRVGSVSGPLARTVPGGLWSAEWNTSGTPDGPVAFRITAVDAAGNERTADLDLIVDNTRPQVTISAPLGGATVSGTATVRWEVVETNPGSVVVLIDRVSHEVTGNTSFAFDAARLAEGSHTIEVRATDRAGNVGTETVRVVVSNQSAQTTASLVTGIGVGAVTAAILGFIAGVVFARRRRRPPAASPPSVAGPWTATPPPGPPPSPPEPFPPPPRP